MPEIVYIGLGSNLAEPISQIKSALRAISALLNTRVLKCSSLYASRPMGPQDQPDYINAVVEIETGLTPEALLDALQTIELNQGRERKENRWGPRTLDLDILLFGKRTINSERLTVPHYGMKKREFVMYPLAEIRPDLILPCGENIDSVLKTIARNGLQQMTMDVEI